MRRYFLSLMTMLSGILGLAAATHAAEPAAPEWSAKVANIEACSCPAFCQCYFTGQPAHHQNESKGERFCRFNNAFKVEEGHWGDTKLE